MTDSMPMTDPTSPKGLRGASDDLPQTAVR